MIRKAGIVWGPAALLAAAVLAGAGSQEKAADLGRRADAKLDEGDRLAREDRIPEALAAYLDAAGLCVQGLAVSAGDKNLAQNRKYALGQRGLIQIQKADRLRKDGKSAEAGRLYAGAEDAYILALAQAGEDQGFRTNLRYARRYGAEVRFQTALQAREPAFSFDLPALSGGAKVGLAALRGQVVLVEFMAGWCPTCRDSLPVLQDLQTRFSGKPVRVVVLASDRIEGWGKSGSAEKSVALLKDRPLLAAWADEGAFFGFGAFSAVPAVFLVDRQGRLAAVVPSSEQGLDALARRIESLL